MFEDHNFATSRNELQMNSSLYITSSMANTPIFGILPRWFQNPEVMNKIFGRISIMPKKLPTL